MSKEQDARLERYMVWMAALILALVMTSGCQSVPYGPDDCKADVELAEKIARRITDRVDRGRTVDPDDWERYATIAKLVVGKGCDYVPKKWAAVEV